jgi:hypothetical protein
MYSFGGFFAAFNCFDFPIFCLLQEKNAKGFKNQPIKVEELFKIKILLEN